MKAVLKVGFLFIVISFMLSGCQPQAEHHWGQQSMTQDQIVAEQELSATVPAKEFDLSYSAKNIGDQPYCSEVAVFRNTYNGIHFISKVAA